MAVLIVNLKGISILVFVLMLYALVGLFVLPLNAKTSNYLTAEFSDQTSRIPTVFVCMFAGHQTGLRPDASDIGMNFFLASGISPEQFDLWAQDAVVYLELEFQDVDLEGYWKQQCEEQFNFLEERIRQ